MKTIEQRWIEFAAAVMPSAASAVQRKEMRRTFYAGFHSALVAGLEIADAAKDSDDVGVTMYAQLDQQLRAFADEVSAGRA